MEGNQRAQRAGVEFVAIVHMVEQFAVQIAIHDTGGNPANLADMRPKCLVDCSDQPKGTDEVLHLDASRTLISGYCYAFR